MGDKIDDEIANSDKITTEHSSDVGSVQSSSVSKKLDRISKKPATMRRFSVDSVNLHQTTTVSNKTNDDVFLPNVSNASSNSGVDKEEEDNFLELLVKSQCSRMNDQRCSVAPIEVKERTSSKETIADKSKISDLRLSLGEENATTSKKLDKLGKKSENRRFSLENMNLLKYSPIKSTTEDDVFIPDESTTNPVTLGVRTSIHPTYNVNNSEEDHFLDLLVRFQGKRMNDQRCSLDPCKNKQ